MNYTELQEVIANYISSFMATHHKPELLYHNIDHTRRVVKNAQQIANHYQLNEHDFFVVTAAAWFHDLGYYSGLRESHEEVGASLATGFLEEKQVDAATIQSVAGCIIATHMPQSPKNLLESIVCDADLFHFGTPEFSERNKLMRKEHEAVSQKPVDKKQWRQQTIKLLESHHFHTDYCKTLLDEQQQINLNKLIDKSEKENPAPLENIPEASGSKNNTKETSRGIETLFRTTSANNQRLSDMADNKASILITVNSIILSVIISVLLRKLDNNTYLTYPTFLILGVSVATMVIGILATRPAIPKGVFTSQDLSNRKVNLLFFGNFYKMDLDTYTKGMWEVMNDREFLYGTLIKDVYSQGVVLGRKYKLLRLAYNIFMFGIVASVLGFIIAIYSIQ